MARLRQGVIGKPSAKRVLGEGESTVIQMGEAGQVYKMSGSIPRDGISRDAYQHAPHMTAPVDPVVTPMNSSNDTGRRDKWAPHPISREGT